MGKYNLLCQNHWQSSKVSNDINFEDFLFYILYSKTEAYNTLKDQDLRAMEFQFPKLKNDLKYKNKFFLFLIFI